MSLGFSATPRTGKRSNTDNLGQSFQGKDDGTPVSMLYSAWAALTIVGEVPTVESLRAFGPNGAPKPN